MLNRLFRDHGVIERAADIICTLSRGGIITSLNPAFERTLGWNAAEWIGKPFAGLVAPECRVALQAGISRLVLLAKDGGRVTFEASVAEGDDFVIVARDVTERDRADSTLRDSRRQFAEAQALANLGSFDHDITAGTVRLSEQASRIFGLEASTEPMSIGALRRMILADDRTLDEVNRTLVARGEHEWEMPIRAAGGTKKIVRCRGKMTVNPSTANAHILGAVRDVTEEKQAETLLKESEERFRLATQAMSEAIWDLDCESGRSWHSEGYRTFGYEPGIMENGFQWWREHIHPEDVERVMAMREEAVQTGQPFWSGEYRLRKADGTYAWVLHRALILRGEEKKPIRVIGALLDMTERKQLVDQLEQAKRVSSLGRVAASIAHEFNNILMGIQPNVEAIQRSSPSGLRVMTENITRAVQRGKRVTDEILRFTRPAEPALQSVDVPVFLVKWKEDIEPLLGAAVELVLEAPVGTYVSADPQQLTQIFTNLALNARDAMEDREGRLTIRGHVSNSFGSFPFGVVKSPDRFVHFTVEDEGCGISPDRLGHIFEPLFTTKRSGIGLGLAITYQIVNRHGGHIFVESEVGHGSMFHVFLPAALPEIDKAPADVESRLGSIHKLLLVEDEPAVASGIAMLLEMEGVQVVTVHTGADSIPAVEALNPDAVILDIGLPDMDGVGVYLEIQERWPELPVLFSSGHGDSTKLETYLARPNVGFILKPYEFDALSAALSQLVDQRRVAKAC